LKTRKSFPTTVVGSFIRKKKEETNNDSQFPVLLGYFISNSVMNVAISLLAIAQKYYSLQTLQHKTKMLLLPVAMM